MTEPFESRAERRRARRDDTGDLGERLGYAQQALDLLAARLGPESVGKPQRDLDRVMQRLTLGVDSTVVALLGGTGSGKSALFNAISGLLFADVGVRRPTTSDPTACVWGSPTDELLDWLGVAKDRRIRRESALDADTQTSLRGLVLLDMPDHDSVVAVHRSRVDRVLPLADLLVWVVDPQKYADEALHSGYLAKLRGHEGAMLVVLNQIDTVPESSRPMLVEDIRQLVAGDGLRELRIATTSARTGEGIKEIRSLLAEIVARRSTAAERAGAELADTSAALRTIVGETTPSETETALDDGTVRVVAEISAACDLSDTVAGISADSPPAGLTAIDDKVAAKLLDLWIDSIERVAPGPWLAAVRAALPEAPDLASRVNDSLVAVEPPSRRTAMAKLAGKGQARRRAESFEADARAAMTKAIDEALRQPAAAVLADRFRVVELLDGAMPVGLAD